MAPPIDGLLVVCCQALKSFSRAFHLNPSDSELYRDDLLWAFDLVDKKAAIEKEQREAAIADVNNSVVCDDLNNDDCSADSVDFVAVQRIPKTEHLSLEPSGGTTDNSCELSRIPSNYVIMRD